MITHLLDTSVYCQPIRRKPLASVRQHWSETGDAKLCISVICEIEVLQGLEMKSSERLWALYRNVLQNRLPILLIERAVAEQYARLAAQIRTKGEPRPQFDLLIAATVLAHRLVVATCDADHFTGIDGLEVEDGSTFEANR